MVHGKMTSEEKDENMQKFVSGQANIMVATTVIEVGVNVPNASVMVIESAERFGLSQLHQLRGRVGRGADQSYCILVTDVKLAKETIRRMEIMTRTNDGFEIAEADLRMRGEGDHVSCLECGKIYYLGETGLLECRCEGEDCKCEIPHIPDWYAWEREEVKREISEGRYSLDIPVKIVVSFDTSKFYEVGEGRLTHNSEGLHVTSDDGNIDYLHKPLASYTICSDFNFYEIGDVISFGDASCLYYCFPLSEGVSVAKVRMAAEEMYKLERARLDAEAAERAAGEKEQQSTD